MLEIISFDKLTIKNQFIQILAKFQQNEWTELNAPYKAPQVKHFRKTIELPDIPFEKQTHFLASENNEFKGFASLWENIGRNEHVVSIDLYIKSQYRRKGIARLIILSVLKQVSPKVKKIQFVMRTDKLAPFYNERKTLEKYQIKNHTKSVYVVRRSASKLKDFD